MPSLIISYASRSSPRIFIYHSSHIILIPFSFHSIIFAFFTFPLIHFTMVLFAISSTLTFAISIYHILLFIIPYSFPSFFNSITLIITHLCFSFSFASMFSIHSFPSIPIPCFLSTTSITLTLIHFHSNPLIPFHFIIPIHFQFLFWLLILTRSVVSSPFIIRRPHSSHSILSSFLLSFLCIQFISFDRFSSSLLYFEIYTMFVRIVVFACSFVVLIGNTQSQLDVITFASDVWFESSSIEWWGNGRMVTWGLERISELEAVITAVDSIGW